MFDKFVTKVREVLADKRTGMVVFGVVVLIAVGFLVSTTCSMGAGDPASQVTADDAGLTVSTGEEGDAGVSLTLTEAEASYVEGVAAPETLGTENEATLTLPEATEIQVTSVPAP